MNFDQIKIQLVEWMKSFVEHPNPALGSWAPCPYAQSARINNKILIVEGDSKNLAQAVNQYLPSLTAYEVVVVCFDYTKISGLECQQTVAELNNKLMQEDCVILEDHPDLVENVAGIKMNFGPCGLLVVQQLSKLNQAADKLRAAGYYLHWEKSELDQVVTWRYQ